MATKPNVAAYEQPEYQSQYQGQIDSALNTVTNREDFSYDPLKDVNYQSLAKVYKKQGEQAAQNTLGDAASLNGGYGSSYAVTASQQARNDYNQQLASQIPALSDAAYNKYVNNYNMNLSALDALRAADDSEYGKYRDTVGDSQWKYGVDYQGYRDDVSDSQWKTSYNRGVYESDRTYKYQSSRDKVSDKQWAQEFALQKKSAAAKSGSSSSSGVNYQGSTNSGQSGLDELLGKVKVNNGLTVAQYNALAAKKAAEKKTSSKKTSSKKTSKKSTKATFTPGKKTGGKR